MDPFQLKATSDVAEDELQHFAAGLRPQIDIDVDKSRAFFRSATAPSWVHVLQTPEFWITTLASNLAWDGVKALARNRAQLRLSARQILSDGILRFSVALALLRERLAVDTDLWIGCPVPNDWFSTLLLIRSGIPEEVASDVALFLLHMPALERFYVKHAHNITGQVTLRLTDDGDMVVTWMDQATLTPQESTFEL